MWDLAAGADNVRFRDLADSNDVSFTRHFAHNVQYAYSGVRTLSSFTSCSNLLQVRFSPIWSRAHFYKALRELHHCIPT